METNKNLACCHVCRENKFPKQIDLRQKIFTALKENVKVVLWIRRNLSDQPLLIFLAETYSCFLELKFTDNVQLGVNSSFWKHYFVLGELSFVSFAIMVKTFQAYLPHCHRTYSCIHCRAHLANHDELISKVGAISLSKLIDLYV